MNAVEDAIEAAAGDWLFQAMVGDLSASQHLGLAFALVEQVGARIGSRGRPLRIWWGRT